MAIKDPFIHHPDLRDLLIDPMASFFRDFRAEDMDKLMADNGMGPEWRLSETDREASRHTTLTRRHGDDLWVFGYGSLCWDPGIIFDEVRRAYVPTHARRFILVDTLGALGDARQPGLMAALDPGPGCHGLVFRIARENIESETYRLWSRERLVPAYTEDFVEAETDLGKVTALTFVADHSAELIHSDITREEQVQYLSTGSGFLGTSFDYAANLQASLAQIGVTDPKLDSLLNEALAHT
jgi:cation transport protein ChaC